MSGKYTFNLLHHYMSTHLCSEHGTSSDLLFLLVQLLFLAFLNNSARVRITISYSILNMPKRAADESTGGPASISPFVTDNRQTNSFCYDARCIVGHQFCTWPVPPPSLSPPVVSSCFANAVDVRAHSLSLLSFVITP